MIDNYFENIRHILTKSPLIQKFELETEKRSDQYMSKEGSLIFRYDNAPHHQKLNLSTFPHHKHDRHEDNVITSEAPSLENVCQEIMKIINQ